MQDAARELRSAVSELTAPGSQKCCRCGIPLRNQLSVNVSDLDQAYEQCDGAKVGVSWYQLASHMISQFDSSKVLVRKGKKVQTTYPAGSTYGRGWLALSFDQLGKALTVLGRMTLVVLSGVVFEMKGCPIGGIASAA